MVKKFSSVFYETRRSVIMLKRGFCRPFLAPFEPTQVKNQEVNVDLCPFLCMSELLKTSVWVHVWRRWAKRLCGLRVPLSQPSKLSCFRDSSL